MDRLRDLIREIHRRSLWQVLGIYVVASFAVLEAVDFLVSSAGLPEWFPTFALALLLVGLPFVLATAFVQEGGPELREKPRDRVEEIRAKSRAATLPSLKRARGAERVRSLFTWRNAATGGVGAIALWGVVATGMLLVAEREAPGRAEGAGAVEDAERLRSIAVLPFESLSDDPENDWFAKGVHDDILTHLSRIAALTVISRTSVLQYAGTIRPTREIAAELGVGAILEGTVRRADGQVKVTVQLIDGRDDSHIWADDYTRPVDDVFAIQTEIAREVASALRAELLPEESERIADRPTADLQAWELYTRGAAHWERYLNEDDTRAAIDLYGAAAERDPTFAEAWAALARARVWAYWEFGADPAELAAAGEALDRSVALAPHDATTLHALGFYHYLGFRDYREALEHFRAALEVRPSWADALARIGWIHRRLGEWEAARDHLSRAHRLDPRGAPAAGGLGEVLAWMGRHEEAGRYLEMARALRPSVEDYHKRTLVLRLGRQGDTIAARRLVEDLQPGVPSDLRAQLTAFVGYWRGDADLDSPSFRWEALDPDYDLWPIHLAMNDPRRAAEAAEALEPSGLDPRGDPRHAVGEHAGTEASPDLWRMAWSLLLRGEHEAARAWMDEYVRRIPLERDAQDGMLALVQSARLRALSGDPEGALELLEDILRRPSPLSPAGARLDPAFASLRDHPGFRTLVSAR